MTPACAGSRHWHAAWRLDASCLHLFPGVTAQPDLNHGVQTGQDVRGDFAGHGNEIARREPKAL